MSQGRGGVPKPTTYIEVPIGSFTRPCQEASCGKTCHFVKKVGGGFKIVDCAADENCRPPTRDEAGVGVSHFTTCSAPNKFTKGKRA